MCELHESDRVHVMAGIESRLLDEAIASALDDCELGIGCFDDLTFGQRSLQGRITGACIESISTGPILSQGLFENGDISFQHWLGHSHLHRIWRRPPRNRRLPGLCET